MNSQPKYFYIKYTCENKFNPKNCTYIHSILYYYLQFDIKLKPVVYFFSKNDYNLKSIRNSIYCFFNIDINIFSNTHKNIKKILKKWSLENRWNWLENNSNNVNWGDMEISIDNLKISYRGAGETDEDAAAMKSFFQIPKNSNIFYFEIKIINKGCKGFIGIGFCKKKTELNKLPGWEASSLGYHGDDGRIFKSSGSGIQYGPTFTTGDTIGACWNLSKKIIFFTKNGIPLKIAFFDNFFLSKMIPIIGLRTFGETIKGNFANSPFEFDANFYIRKESEITLNKTIKFENLLNFTIFHYLKSNKSYKAKKNVSEHFFFNHFFLIVCTKKLLFRCRNINRFIILSLSIGIKKKKAIIYFIYLLGTKYISCNQKLSLNLPIIQMVLKWSSKNLPLAIKTDYFDIKKLISYKLVSVLITNGIHEFFFNKKKILQKILKIWKNSQKNFFVYYWTFFLILEYSIHRNFIYNFAKFFTIQVIFILSGGKLFFF